MKNEPVNGQWSFHLWRHLNFRLEGAQREQPPWRSHRTEWTDSNQSKSCLNGHVTVFRAAASFDIFSFAKGRSTPGSSLMSVNYIKRVAVCVFSITIWWLITNSLQRCQLFSSPTAPTRMSWNSPINPVTISWFFPPENLHFPQICVTENIIFFKLKKKLFYSF